LPRTEGFIDIHEPVFDLIALIVLIALTPPLIASIGQVHGVDYGVQLWNPDLQPATSPTTSDSYDYDRVPLGPFIEIG
jgi:hypothetical protein